MSTHKWEDIKRRKPGQQRNPDRIPLIVAMLEQAWAKYPDLRLGQLLANLDRLFDENPFFYEDCSLETCLDALVNECGNDLNEYMRRRKEDSGNSKRTEE